MRIFIYSRKSKWTGRGESVENQIAMCRDYIRCHMEGAGCGEIVEFEDEGYSGKNTKRPQFQKMMQRIREGECSCLVCYKLDRLGRNIADLADLVETLHKLNVSFISIKERFDTSTPIGKAMLYFAGVLAQMEREQIAERVRDNMIMLARKGRWLGGNTPLGFDTQAEEAVSLDGKRRQSFRLTVKEEEMKTVRFIFKEYMEKQSLTGIVRYFLSHDIRTKRGREYTTTTVKEILSNPVYCTADREAYDYFWALGCQVCMEASEADGKYGLMSYARTSSAVYKSRDNAPEKWIIARGRHRGIVPGRDFVRIQDLLARNSGKGETWRRIQNPVALLPGLLYCSCGRPMRPKNYASAQVTEKGERRFSYLCPCKELTHKEKCGVANVQGNRLDALVCREVLTRNEKYSSAGALLKAAAALAWHGEEERVSSSALLQLEIERRKKEEENLMRALEQGQGGPVLVSRIGERIEELEGECAALELEREEALTEEEKEEEEAKGRMEALEESLSSFQDLFGTLTVAEKREYLRMVIDRIVWDGEEAHIFFS